MSDDDDFQEIPFTQATQPRLKPSDSTRRPPKRQKGAAAAAPDKENVAPSRKRGDCLEKEILKSKGSYLCNSIESRLLNARSGGDGDIARGFSEESGGSYLCNYVESRLLEPRSDGDGDGNGGFCFMATSITINGRPHISHFSPAFYLLLSFFHFSGY